MAVSPTAPITVPVETWAPALDGGCGGRVGVGAAQALPWSMVTMVPHQVESCSMDSTVPLVMEHLGAPCSAAMSIEVVPPVPMNKSQASTSG